MASVHSAESREDCMAESASAFSAASVAFSSAVVILGMSASIVGGKSGPASTEHMRPSRQCDDLDLIWMRPRARHHARGGLFDVRDVAVGALNASAGWEDASHSHFTFTNHNVHRHHG